MFTAIKQFFTAITVFFSAFEKSASAINNLAGWADEASKTFVEEAAIERQARIRDLRASLNVTTTPTTPAP